MDHPSSRPALEVADVFRFYGAQYKTQQQGHLSLHQLKVMSAIERCRSAQLGGHQLHCGKCETDLIAYNSCRNRHCPKCQSSAAKRWLKARQAQLLPVEYYHVVFTLPEEVAQLAFYNKAHMYDLLFSAASQTLNTIARDPKHLGADIGSTMVLHTWGSAMTHHPHVHCIVPGGGISLDKHSWKSCKKGFFLPVRVLSRLFRRLYMQGVRQLYKDEQLQCFGKLAGTTSFNDSSKFNDWTRAQQQREWVVYAKRPFAGPQAVLAYLSRYTHRVAIANSRLQKMDKYHVHFKYKDYRRKGNNMHKVMRVDTDEFIRRFMLHVLPNGFHRIRHYGLLGSQTKLKRARQLLKVTEPEPVACSGESEASPAPFTCRQCHSPLTIMAITEPIYRPRAPPK
ncbi:IS91 family transposase [Paraglaciecola sp. L3A3]|uniref:IS91 family transposase n=1 Tax=Paraglaciecola sp. L3A3 TaxID=2686358 RepID=UPI00131EAE23|nr:IS91 family transposase [Paraglaciecola sp. L3A3]